MRWFPAAAMIVLLGFGTAGAQPSPAGDPPALVGRVARVQGTVSQHGAGADRWEPAVPNFPVTSGSAVWTEPGAQADLGIAGSRIVLDGGTELDIDRLDATAVQATLPRGEVFLHLMAGTPAAELRTPRGTAQLAVPGRYGLAVGDTDHPTVLTVVEGTASFAGQGVDQRAVAGQAITVTGTDTLTGSVGPGQPDAFLAAQLARERPARPQAATPPQAVRGMTGWEALEEYGQWRTAPEYGVVWYPEAGADYVPYRQGRWAWVAPWGWTWVDDAPWGFAPSHYGRWVRVEDRWAWAPVLPSVPVEAVPVYAPAVVSFVDVAGAALVGAGLGYAVGAGRPRPVGWVPLGWQEPYVPPYRASQTYLRQINVTNVTNIGSVTIRNGVGRPFANRAAATVVPGDALTRFQPVAPVARPLPPAAAVRPVFGRPAIAPGTATAGLTPAVARQFRLATPAFPPAPGPALRAGPGLPGGAQSRVGLPGLPGPGRPGAPPAIAGLPPLHAPAATGAEPSRAERGAVAPLAQPRPTPGRPEVLRPTAPAMPVGPQPPRVAGSSPAGAPRPSAPMPQERRMGPPPERHAGPAPGFRAPSMASHAPPPQVMRPAPPPQIARPMPPQMLHPAAAPPTARPGPPPNQGRPAGPPGRDPHHPH